MIRHAGLIARFQGGGWRGVLIEGPSGAGKSDLALRALDQGWSLIADDRTLVWTSGRRLWGRAPDALAGLIEARGLGVVAVPRRAFAPVALVAKCVEPGAVERIPEAAVLTLQGLPIPLIAVAAHEASAPAKLGRALMLLDSSSNRRIKRPALARVSPGAGGVP
ncbi:MAG TPA: HPr kinase/phosphorylase [Caulobacteraceae bacterium]|jgi:serine kinase of HPr protein (carbohydrate metabolism regulator)|nr:HPr kinase/phosphorylase [Caulobacteraceae bacterium]